MKHRTLIGLAGILVVAAVEGSAMASAQEAVAVPPAPPTITVDGSASATLVPDTAVLSLAVVSTRATATEAVSANSAALQRALMTLRADGVAPDAITTAALNLTPVYDEPKTGTPAVVGYAARNELRVRLQTSLDISRLVARMIDEGVNAIDGITFTSTRLGEARDRLKGDAGMDAKHQAEIYATALGLHLGKVLGIRPAFFDSTQEFRAKIAAPLAARAPVPIEPGMLNVTESVSVTFELIQ